MSLQNFAKAKFWLPAFARVTWVEAGMDTSVCADRLCLSLSLSLLKKDLLEAKAGIEPANRGFAVHCITTLLLGHILSFYNNSLQVLTNFQAKCNINYREFIIFDNDLTNFIHSLSVSSTFKISA